MKAKRNSVSKRNMEVELLHVPWWLSWKGAVTLQCERRRLEAANSWSHRIWRQIGRSPLEQLSLKDCNQGNRPAHAGAVRDQPQPHLCTLMGEQLRVKGESWGWERGCSAFVFVSDYLILLYLIIDWATFPQVKYVLPMVATGKWFCCLCLKLRDFLSHYFHLITWGGGMREQLYGSLALGHCLPTSVISYLK